MVNDSTNKKTKEKGAKKTKKGEAKKHYFCK